VPLAAQAARSLFTPATTYWGNTNAWDVLWLGHCGDFLGEQAAKHAHPDNLTSSAHVLYADSTLPARSDLHPFTQNFLNALGVPEQTRFLHASGNPLCTFGYAVTRAGAAAIVDRISHVSRPESTAFDVSIMFGCRVSGLRCYSLNPEVFHHMPGTSLVGTIDGAKSGLPPVDKAAVDQTRSRGETANIDCGFWRDGGDFAFESSDDARLEWLRMKVGREGRCLKRGRELPNPDEGAKTEIRTEG